MVKNKVTNLDIAVHLSEIGSLFSKIPEPWKARAFFKVANYLRKNPDLEIYKNNQLIKIPGAGKAINDVIMSFIQTGTSKKYQKLIKNVKINEPVKFSSNKVRKIIDNLFKDLKLDWGYAGSMRRGQKKIKDVDVIVCIKNDQEKQTLRQYLFDRNLEPNIRNGDKKWGISILIDDKEITLDLNFCTPENKGAYYLYFTGSKEFNIEMRSYVKKLGLKLNEYGLFKDDVKLASKTEKDIFQAMSLKYLDPLERKSGVIP